MPADANMPSEMSLNGRTIPLWSYEQLSTARKDNLRQRAMNLSGQIKGTAVHTEYAGLLRTADTDSCIRWILDVQCALLNGDEFRRLAAATLDCISATAQAKVKAGKANAHGSAQAQGQACAPASIRSTAWRSCTSRSHAALNARANGHHGNCANAFDRQ